MIKNNKYIIIGTLLLLLIISILLILNNNKDNNSISKKDSNNNTVVLYFSVTNNTENIAEYIQEITKSDIIEIIPIEKYSNADINYSNKDSRATKEQNNPKSRPKIRNKINLDEYETIYLGYPIWWEDVPKIILTLLDNYNLEDKTIIPFCTSGSTDIANSVETLRNYNDKLNILDGKRFSSTSTKEEVETWINSINTSE